MLNIILFLVQAQADTWPTLGGFFFKEVTCDE